jgi:hypothetical protein
MLPSSKGGTEFADMCAVSGAASGKMAIWVGGDERMF